MRRLMVHLSLTTVLLAGCVSTEQTTPAPVTRQATRIIPQVPSPTPSLASGDQTLDLHVQITDGLNPIEGTIWLYWPDTGGDLAIGPTSDIVLPVPADGAAISVTVTAPGYPTWSRMLTPTESLDLVVRLGQKAPASDL
jgi:hypothetical protein